MEYYSIFDILKIGVGPSSSHTMGPWKAALMFVEHLKQKGVLHNVDKLYVDLYGSLALTGKGHGTDVALILGLSGYNPKTVLQKTIQNLPLQGKDKSLLTLSKLHTIDFSIKEDIRFHRNKKLDFHPNGMKLSAFNASKEKLYEATYFSVGGGFVIQKNQKDITNKISIPYPIETAADIKKHCESQKQTIAWVVRENEKFLEHKNEVDVKILELWQTMLDSIFNGCRIQGTLPGGLQVKRRAAKMFKDLLGIAATSFSSCNEFLEALKEIKPDFENTLKYVSCFAMAVNEENANFGRIVTAPTNGAAGVIPAVLFYFICFSKKNKITDEDIINFLCVASEIGSVFKKQATISAALGGCQAEIGVSSAMAAAALTSVSGGTVDQSLMAAEIAMEHHLGLTCDPIGGLVQIPCIERNSMGAIKAITASQIAMTSDPTKAKVSLDDVIKTMWRTAQDMNSKYKETSQGGLAVQVPVSIPEC